MKLDASLVKYLGQPLAEKLESGKLSGEETRQASEKLNRLFAALSPYLPRGLHARRQGLIKGEKLTAAILLADVSGFTTLSERLSRTGKEGAEEVTSIINGYFSPLIKIALKYGGDLIRFGGDSITVIFEPLPDETAGKERRAAQAAWEMAEFVKNFAEVKTSIGSFPVGLHLALHTGSFTICRVGSEKEGLQYLLAGQSAAAAARLEDEAEAGQILISKEMHQALTGSVKDEKKSGDTFQLLELTDQAPAGLEQKEEADLSPETMAQKIQDLAAYLPPWLFQRMIADPKSGAQSGEHTRATALFLSFSGLDFDHDASAVAKLQNYYQVLQQTVKSYDGHLNKIDSGQDGQRALILFGAPQSHEDDEIRAALCGLEMLSHQEFSYGGMHQKFGINSGYVFAGTVGSAARREYTAMGDEVNLAARLMGSAQDEELLITEATHRKCKNKFLAEPLGERQFKGKAHPISIFKVTAKKEVGEDIFAKWISESKAIVGRSQERELLNQAIEKTLLGKGQIVSIAGEAGIGKSRLTRDLTSRWMERGYTLFGGSCQSYGQAISYLPWSELLEAYLGLKKTDSPEQKARKIEKALAIIDPQLKDWAPIIGEITGAQMPETQLTKSLDAKLRQQRLFDLALDLASWGASQEPLMLILEDLHWADGASMELLNYLARNIGEKAILLCLVYRPLETQHEFAAKDYHQAINLKELTPEESLELVHSLLAIEGMPPELEALILKKSQGNPFFVEEVVKSLIEQKVVDQKDGKWQVVASEVKNVNIPDTVQGVIKSRVDRLSYETKEALQFASVIGREFSFNLLSGIYPQKEQIKPALADLNRFDLVLLEGEDGYMFKHIMTQEVAYDSLPFAKRRELHNAIGDQLEEAHQGKIEEAFGLLAHHYYHANNWEPAFFYSVEAGDKAKKVYANQEALAHYDRSLEIFDKMVEAGMLPELTKRIEEEIKAEEAKKSVEMQQGK
ncbi:AAA family ATPase [candidate division TA06 bacterium]|uniref:AAA family ATPase n=1 Tax=candidate division TA06 bacterium TaxID=2250710 RepID=A0A933MKV7_UNCT6|nr:AAA family ATPase [candidate division TA06 bacterium]